MDHLDLLTVCVIRSGAAGGENELNFLVGINLICCLELFVCTIRRTRRRQPAPVH